MGTYTTTTERDRWGNIVGYRSVSTGEIVEWTGAESPEFQRLFALSQMGVISANERRKILDEIAEFNAKVVVEKEKQEKRERINEFIENPDFLEIV